VHSFEEIRQQLEILKDEELISILREHNEEQWRPEVFDIVNAILRERGVSPGEGREEPAKEDVTLDETAGLDLVTVAGYVKYIDAETDRLALEAKGLRAWITNENVQLWGPIVPGAQLQVRAEDLDAAKAILEAEPVPSSDLPSEIAEPPCPKCGSRQVTEVAELADASASDSMTSWFYHCASCDHKWPEA
jgi:DNA-directed RNA polymerase subunit M/transcription elongation factor TFIIS